ncbi:12688_t:CDS:1, partial [Entrophospora sp. SA101]
HVVDHKQKSTIDNHLESNSHKKNKLEIQNSSRAIPRQQTITSLHKNISERQGININLVKTLVEANIPLEKLTL